MTALASLGETAGSPFRLLSQDCGGPGLCSWLEWWTPVLLEHSAFFFLAFCPLFTLLASGLHGWAFCSLEGRSCSWKGKVQSVGWSGRFVVLHPVRDGRDVLLHVLVYSTACVQCGWRAGSKRKHCLWPLVLHALQRRSFLLPHPAQINRVAVGFKRAMLLCSRVPSLKLRLGLPELPCFVQALIVLGTSGRNLRVEVALTGMFTCWKPALCPARSLCFALSWKRSRERRTQMF